MPGSIHISATQPPATPLFLQVAVGKKEYSGNIEQDGLSFPVTSLRESILIMLYNVDRELISKTELDTKTIVESGTRDVVFRLGSGGEVILQMQFLLSDADRRRIQEMRSSVLKRKQQELPGDGLELNLPDSTLTKRLIEKISNIENKRDQTYLQKSLLPDDLPDRAILSGINMDPGTRASRDLLLQNDGRKSEDPNASRKGHGNGEPESRSSSAVKKMISAFESTSSQGILRSETGASLTLSSGTGRKDREADEAIVPLVGAKDSSYRSRKQALLLENQGQDESRSHRLNGHDGVSKLEVREHELMSRGKLEVKKHRRSKSMGPFSLEQLHSMGSLSKCYLERPLNYLVAASSTWLHPHVCVTTASRELKGLLEVENLRHIRHADESEISESRGEDDAGVASASSAGGSGGFSLLNLNLNLNLNGWLVNQGVRAAIVVIACGAVFLGNR